MNRFFSVKNWLLLYGGTSALFQVCYDNKHLYFISGSPYSMNNTHPWEKLPYLQSVHYPDPQKLLEVTEQLSILPPLVTSGEIKRLRQELHLAERGDAFILQGGDCAESFSDCRPESISRKLKILLQMRLILMHGLHKRIVPIGRIAGQYAKPRSQDMEIQNGLSLPSYRGDLINSSVFEHAARQPDPIRLLQGYSCAAMTLNFIRALIEGGFTDIHHPEQWDVGFVEFSSQAVRYKKIVANILRSLEFIESVNHQATKTTALSHFYTSHEALHLHYEQALTRIVKDGLTYNLSTHFPWLGMRTAKVNTAHVAYLSKIQNPVGIKVGPGWQKNEIEALLETLNPAKQSGKIALITRFGAARIRENLPQLLEHVKQLGHPVTWICDPMHGNTENTDDGYKTRRFDNILSEINDAMVIHKGHQSHLGGIHLELSGDNVTECIGGARGLEQQDLARAYESSVDPRLNYEQSLEIALHLSESLAVASALSLNS